MSEASQKMARLACHACRRQKRKCNRELPACELCTKNRRLCEYPAEALDWLSDPSSADLASNLRHRRDGATNLYFLDSYMFKHTRASLTRSQPDVSGDLLYLVEDGDQVLRDVETYFECIHPVLPIISKLRLQHVMNSAVDRDADLTLLLIVIKLLCRNSTGDMESSSMLYPEVKRYYHQLEMTGTMSTRMLQSCLLIAYYELANSIYPGAYLTVGMCVRLGYALRVHVRRLEVHELPHSRSLVEDEQLRRIWWAVVVLDNFVGIGLDGRASSTADARPSDYLPMDDGSWDLGEPSIRPSLAVSAEVSLAAPPFARTCQAAHLLSRVLRHANEQPEDYQSFYEEAIHLSQVVSSFGAALAQVAAGLDNTQLLALYPAIGICFSAQLSLYDAHTCAEVDFPKAVGLPVQLEMQQLALDGMKAACHGVVEFGDRIKAAVEAGMAAFVSPLVANCLFQAAKNICWLLREAPRQELWDALQAPVDALKGIGRIWAVGEEYLTILSYDSLRPPGGLRFSQYGNATAPTPLS